MKENYDGYKFGVKVQEKMYNSNMCLYFLSEYTAFNEIPERLVDVNIASDYSKLVGMLDTCTNENKQEIIEKTISREGIITDITEKFNPEIGFGGTKKIPRHIASTKRLYKNYNAVMIEFKYLKKEEKDKLEEKQKEAKEQIIEYSEFEDIRDIPNLNKYI